MRVIGQNGEHAFLIEINDVHTAVLDIEGEPTLSQYVSRDSILSYGYWEPFVGDERTVLDLTTAVATDGDELPAVGWDVPAHARRLSGVRAEPKDLGGVTLRVDSSMTVCLVGGAVFVSDSERVWRDEVIGV